MYACVYKFHSMKAMQDVHLCMYVCMCVCIHIYVSQGDFRLMSFTAGRCGTPLIPNDQLRRNGVRSSDLIPNDQLRRNGVRSSDLILNDQLRRNGVRSSDLIVCVSVCVSPVPSVSEPIVTTNRTRSADERSESAGVGPKAPGGQAKRGRRRRTERTLRTEPH